MEPRETKKNESLQTKPVKEILEPTTSVETRASVESAVDRLKSENSESAPATDPEGTLVGKISKDKMNRGVSGRGHDPKTTQVEPQVEKDCEPYCYENESIGKAEEVMREAKADEVSVVSGEKKLLGKATRGGIEEAQRDAAQTTDH